MRKAIKRFYDGVVVCEDPACSGRTRQLPLHFASAYPLCPTCGKGGNMYKEYTEKELYTQLEYLAKLFDLEYVANNYGVELSPGRDAAVIKQCLDLKQHVMKTMDLNKYSIVDMGRLFAGFFALKASSLRKTKAF